MLPEQPESARDTTEDYALNIVDAAAGAGQGGFEVFIHVHLLWREVLLTLLISFDLFLSYPGLLQNDSRVCLEDILIITYRLPVDDIEHISL
jgi:hypothetical protein